MSTATATPVAGKVSDADPSVLADPSLSISNVLENDQKGTLRSEPHKMYSLAAAAWLTVLAIPLLAFPRVLSLIFGSLLTEASGENEGEVIRQLNVLERSLAGLTGLSLLTLGLILIIQTGAVPLTASISHHHQTPDALFRVPTIIVTTGFFSMLSWQSYDLGLWLVTGISGILSVWGLWAIMFATESTVNKVGKNMTTSSFPFKNEFHEAKKL